MAKCSMDSQEIEFLRRIADAQERIATAVEKQPSRAEQFFAVGAAVATTFGIVSIIDIIKNWIGG